LYANHRLIIFADSRHFLDPISCKLYGWSDKFHEWQNPFLFTPELPQHWDYYKQQLHEAGFVVLATGQQGLEKLVSYISVDLEAINEERGNEANKYPILLQQRPRRFLERHAPTAEIVAELLTQLDNYLGQAGFNWLAACAIYPELHWQLTLYLGQREDLSGLDEALLLRLARLPWLRYGYMPDWLREALLVALNNTQPQEEQKIRSLLEKLFSEISRQKQGNDFSLTIAQKLPSLDFIRDGLFAWQNRTDSDNPFHDYVFQSFMAGRLTVKFSKIENSNASSYDGIEIILKRSFDIIFSLTCLTFISWLLLLISLSIKLLSPGPVIF
jgi:hypothetical protein